MDPELLIHIGYHKTGSSYLQHVVFPREDLPFALLERHNMEVASPIRFAHPFTFNKVAVRETLMRQAAEAAQNGRVPVLSHEGLSGFLGVGGFDSMRILERLHSVAPKAKILIGIREQESMLLSIHNQQVRKGCRQSLDSFLTDDSNSFRSFQLVHLAFHHLIGAYQDAFGKDRVLVAPLESLKHNPDAFTRKILAFSQPHGEWATTTVPPSPITVINPSTPPVGIAIKRQLNRFASVPYNFQTGELPFFRISKSANNKIKSWVRRAGRYAPASLNENLKHKYKSIIRKKVGDYYVESNQKTAEMTGLDLEDLGYRTR